MSAVAIEARGLGKRYRKGADTHGRLIHWLRQRGKADFFWALDDVSFEVHEGEMLGVVGPNGAGKSTLLKILSRITRPNAGEVRIRGRVGSLLEVGTGFHPELTGRENIYLNGALIGIDRKGITRRFDEIVDFSGIDDFLDTPLKRYSTGMKVRLGFAVAVHLQQEIMLVDEVLSVGDTAFREKCLAKMEEVTGHGRTVLFVGHNLEMIRTHCDRALWLDHGRVRAEGSPVDIVRRYEEDAGTDPLVGDGFLSLDDRASTFEAGTIRLTHLRLADGSGGSIPALRSGDAGVIGVGYTLEESAESDEPVAVELRILSPSQVVIATCTSVDAGIRLADLAGSGELLCRLPRVVLRPGKYRFAVRCRVNGRVVFGAPSAGTFHVVSEDADAELIRGSDGAGPLLLEEGWDVSSEAIE